MKILLTGCAGFIGSHTVEALLAADHQVVGIDNFDPFYSRAIKNANLAAALENPAFELIEGDLADAATYTKLKFHLGSERIDAIIHLAAKAGVRPSIADPIAYQRANVIATQNVLEFARQHQIQQFVFASSSSVYGVNPKVPWSESDAVLRPISPYASTKVSCELMGHVYSHLYGLRVLGLRFFTVYGPRQRPDLAINKFLTLIEQGAPIPVFGDGSTRRDYTYISDIVQGILAAVHYQDSDFELINLGNDQTISLQTMISTIESVTGKTAQIDRQPEQPGDVPQTWANIGLAKRLLDYQPKTQFSAGIQQYYRWWTEQKSANFFGI